MLFGGANGAGEWVPLADTGVFDWVARLSSNSRLRFIASGLGLQLVAMLLPAGPELIPAAFPTRVSGVSLKPPDLTPDEIAMRLALLLFAVVALPATASAQTFLQYVSEPHDSVGEGQSNLLDRSIRTTARSRARHCQAEPCGFASYLRNLEACGT